MASAARRSLGFNLENAERADFISRSLPLSTAVRSATVVGWSAPQMKVRALARRSSAARSIDGSSIEMPFRDSYPTIGSHKGSFGPTRREAQ
jgi:hypothetical protein